MVDMGFKVIETRVEGLFALLQNRFSEQAEAAGATNTRPTKEDYGTPREQAEQVVYRSKDGDSFYMPGSYFAAAIREAGANHKQTSSRRQVKHIVPAAVILLDDAIPLLEPGTSELIRDYEVDWRPVQIPATKGRIMRARPRFEKWSAVFHIQIDEEVLGEPLIHQLLEEAGRRLGVGDFRPQKGGPFGRFRVVHWGEFDDSPPPEPPVKRRRRTPVSK